MAVVTLLERSFALVVSNAGVPGLRVAHPNIELEASSQDPDVVAVLNAFGEDGGAAEAIWAILVESGAAEAMARLQHRALTQLAKGQSRDAENARKALTAWPQDEAGQPRMAQAEDARFVNVCGARILDTAEGPSRQRGRRVTF